MCDTCATIGEIKLELLLLVFLDDNPELKWIYNGYKKFRSQLPDDVIAELETQISTLAKNVAASNYQLSVISNIVTYIILFLIILFIFICIIVNNSTLTYFLMAISLILIIVGILGILWYTDNNVTSILSQTTSITHHLKTIFTDAKDSGLCCIAGVDCGNSCTGGCECANIPIIQFNYTISGLSVTFTDISPPTVLPVFARQWNFGDGTNPQNGTTVTHVYQQAGTYNVTLLLALSPCQPTPCEPVYEFTSAPTTITLT